MLVCHFLGCGMGKTWVKTKDDKSVTWGWGSKMLLSGVKYFLNGSESCRTLAVGNQRLYKVLSSLSHNFFTYLIQNLNISKIPLNTHILVNSVFCKVKICQTIIFPLKVTERTRYHRQRELPFYPLNHTHKRLNARLLYFQVSLWLCKEN